MAEIGFYHLTRTSVEQALPRLLGRVLDNQQRAMVLCANEERGMMLSDALWASTDPVWLPHGTSRTEWPEMQPILIATPGTDTDAGPAANGAAFLFLTDGVAYPDLGPFQRVFDLFDGQDDQQVAQARKRWATAKAAGHALTYWQQGARGWEKKA